MIEIAGSLRRGRDTVGDIELVAVPRVPTNLFGQRIKGAPDLLTSHLRYRKVPMTLDGDRLKRFVYRGIPVDLAIVHPDDIGRYGWRMVLSTGSAKFNRWLVTPKSKGGGMPAGMKADEGWLWAREGPGQWPSRLHTPDETSVFHAMKLPGIPPRDRDANRWLKIVKEAKII